MNLKEEENRILTTQDVYDIVNFSVQAANDDGFMNPFIFERALYAFAALYLCEEETEELRPIIARNINEAWDWVVNEGLAGKLVEDYREEIDYLANVGGAWLEDYTKYAYSARGLLNTLQAFSGDIVNAAADQFKEASKEVGVEQVLQIADEWGMNREKDTEESVEEDALFEDK